MLGFMRRKTWQSQDTTPPRTPDYRKSPHYKGNLDETLEFLSTTLGQSDDYMVRIMEIYGHAAACVFISTICDHKAIEECLRAVHEHKFPQKKPKNLAQYLIEKVLPGSDCLFMTNLYEIREVITSGDLVLFIDGVNTAIAMGAKYVEHRTPEQPFIESSVRGAQISFVESLDINVGLIRQGLNTDTLHIKKMKVGYRSRTDIAIAFLADVANPVLVDTVIKRINALHIDVINQGAALEHQIMDHKWTLFPLTRSMQRIDSAIHEINQGKVAIIVDGDPTIMIVPATIQDFFQTSEDFSHTFYESTVVRWLRFVSFIFALYLPSLYISFTDFNPELLPKILGIQIAKSREGVPFPAFVEVLIMQLMIEILREATLRMPKQMGQTIGIVGGLVVGEASVQAGIVSNILIIVVAFTAVSIFVSPSYEFSVVLRIGCWMMDLAAAIFGLYGVVLLTIFGIYEICYLKSFGVSYADPFNGEHFSDLFKDGILRVPTRFLTRRTRHLHTLDSTGEPASGYQMPVQHPQLLKASSRVTANRGRRRNP